MEKGLYKERIKKTKKTGKEYWEEKNYNLTPRPYPSKEMWPNGNDVVGIEPQVTKPRVLVAMMGSEMNLGNPCSDAGVNAGNIASLIGPTGEPHKMSLVERPTKL